MMIEKSIFILILAIICPLQICGQLGENNVPSETNTENKALNTYVSSIGQLIDPIPLMAAIVIYTILKFTGVFGFLQLVYTIINQLHT